jgi:hypothetical protein
VAGSRDGERFLLWVVGRVRRTLQSFLTLPHQSSLAETRLRSVAFSRIPDPVAALSATGVTLLKHWVALNLSVIVSYWDGGIEYSEDAITAMKPIENWDRAMAGWSVLTTIGCRQSSSLTGP